MDNVQTDRVRCPVCGKWHSPCEADPYCSLKHQQQDTLPNAVQAVHNGKVVAGRVQINRKHGKNRID